MEAAAVSNKPATNQYILPYLPFKQSVAYNDGMLIICYTVIIFALFLLPPFAIFLIFWYFKWLLATVCQYDVFLVGVGVDCCVEQQNSASNHPYGGSTIELVCSYIILQLYT